MSQWRFNDSTLRVQIHNIPPLYHNSSNALGLARLIGEPADVGFQGGQELAKPFLRVHVRVDLTIPLTLGAYVTDCNEVIWAPFSYENVFHFCKDMAESVKRNLCVLVPVSYTHLTLPTKRIV